MVKLLASVGLNEKLEVNRMVLSLLLKQNNMICKCDATSGMRVFLIKVVKIIIIIFNS